MTIGKQLYKYNCSKCTNTVVRYLKTAHPVCFECSQEKARARSLEYSRNLSTIRRLEREKKLKNLSKL